MLQVLQNLHERLTLLELARDMQKQQQQLGGLFTDRVEQLQKIDPIDNLIGKYFVIGTHEESLERIKERMDHIFSVDLKDTKEEFDNIKPGKEHVLDFVREYCSILEIPYQENSDGSLAVPLNFANSDTKDEVWFYHHVERGSLGGYHKCFDGLFLHYHKLIPKEKFYFLLYNKQMNEHILRLCESGLSKADIKAKFIDTVLMALDKQASVIIKDLEFLAGQTLNDFLLRLSKEFNFPVKKEQDLSGAGGVKVKIYCAKEGVESTKGDYIIFEPAESMGTSVESDKSIKMSYYKHPDHSSSSCSSKSRNVLFST